MQVKIIEIKYSEAKKFSFHSWKWGIGEKNGGRANWQNKDDRPMTSCQGIQSVYKSNMYTFYTPGCTSLYPFPFNTKYVHPLYAQKERECTTKANWKCELENVWTDLLAGEYYFSTGLKWWDKCW